MQRHLVKNESQYMELFEPLDLHQIESYLGIEVAYEDGTYQTDYLLGKISDIDENQDIDIKIYRKTDRSQFPQSYPCIVIFDENLSDSIHGFGGEEQIDTRFFFIYPNDF